MEREFGEIVSERSCSFLFLISSLVQYNAYIYVTFVWRSVIRPCVADLL